VRACACVCVCVGVYASEFYFFLLLFIAKEREVFGERRGFIVVKSSEAIYLRKNDKADVFCSQQTIRVQTARVFARFAFRLRSELTEQH
jgi:hypothetical protein